MRSRPLVRAIALAVLALPALVQLARVISLIAGRVRYPIALEWMEDGAILEAHRLLHGLPIYGPPSQHFVPYPYPPLHVVAMAALGSVFGLDYATGRIVSLASLAVTGGLTAALAVRGTSSRVSAAALILAVTGALATVFPLTDGMVDTIRSDTLTMALTVGAVVLLDTTHLPSVRRLLGAAVLLTASVYTRQTAIFFAAWLVAFIGWRDRRRGIVLGLSTLTLASAALIAMQVATAGWFLPWVLNMRGHGLTTRNLGNGLGRVMWHAPFLALVPLAIVRQARAGKLSSRSVLWAGMIVAALVASFLPLAKEAGWMNDLVPILVLAWPATIVIMREAGWAPWRVEASLGVTGAALLALQVWDPRSMVPTRAARARAEDFGRLIRELGDGVEVPSFPFFAVKNGASGNQISIAAYLDTNGTNLATLPGAAIDASEARWLILCGYPGDDLIASTTHAYRLVRRLDFAGEAFFEPPDPLHSPGRSLWERIDALAPRPQEP